MAALIGLVLGALVGRWWFDEWGAIIGGLAGFIAGALVSGQRQRDRFRKPELGSADASAQRLEARLTMLEQRLAAIEAVLKDVAPVGATAPAQPRDARPEAALTAPSPEPATIAVSTAPDSSSERPPADVIAPRDAQQDTILEAARIPARASSPNALWAWFIGGNAITRIGVLALLIGVGFLLRFFAEHFTIPIEVRLLGVALAGIVLAAIGWRVARTRPAYGWSLQGAGMGVLYLTAYAAQRQFDVIGPGTSLVLLAVISAATVWLALLADSEALAALALTGAFLAPILAGSDRSPVPLFSYFAVVNAVVLVIATTRTWRAVSIIGFVFTFVLGIFWGDRYYRPEHFAVVEPFLALFFAAYVAIAFLQARTAAAGSLATAASAAKVRALDGVLVFGVPLLAFSLQVALVHDTRYGAAWSAVALAVVYAALGWWLRDAARAVPLLSRSFTALAAVFASVAIPFAFDNRVTAALWSLEAALVYWLGLQQRSFWTRAFALALQLAAGVLFAISGVAGPDDRLFLNAFFIGTAMLALAGFATAFLADRHVDRLDSRERDYTVIIFAWAALWWLAGGGVELVRQLPRMQEAHAVLAWVIASSALAAGLGRSLTWSRLLGVALALPIAMIVVALRDVARVQTTLTYVGWLVWPAAWVVAFIVLRVLDAIDAHRPAGTSVVSRWRESAHAAAALALTAQCAWELSEWAGRVTATDTVWVACAAALPAIAYLALALFARRSTRWPFGLHSDAYVRQAAAPVAVLLAIWIVAVNLLSPGEPDPLPYVPLLNPLEISLALAFAVLLAWSAAHGPLSERRRYALLGIGVFLTINGGILRVGHHLGGIAWDLSALLGSRSLQAALTLAWTVTGAALMFAAARRALRPLWMVGAALLALVVLKLFVLDLSALSGLPRVIAFLGVGGVLLLIGYVSPLPPSSTSTTAQS